MKIPIIERAFPELRAYDLISTQTMCSSNPSMDYGFDIITNHFPSREFEWMNYKVKDYSLVIDDFKGWIVFEISFESIERKNKDENEYLIGKSRTRKSKGVDIIEIIAEKDCQWITTKDSYVTFKNSYIDGDILVYFKSPENSWYALAGREGFAIVRNNKVIKQYITTMN